VKRKIDIFSKGIPVIDIFAGPGGLGEGFTSLTNEKGERIFDIALSIEKDPFARQTLKLRSFLRQFPHGQFPKEYYSILREKKPLEDLYKLYKKESDIADHEAWQAELGKTPDKEIDKRIAESLKGKKEWILIGGPPCQAYSLVGRSRRQETQLDPDKDERVYLYQQYLRIIAEHKPLIFVMENVKGLLSAEVKKSPVFEKILNDLTDPEKAIKGIKRNEFSRSGYNIYSLVREPRGLNLDGSPEYEHSDFVIKAEDYGIPQTRHRVILLGIRKDFDVKPKTLTKVNKKVNVKDVIEDLPRLRSGVSKNDDSFENWLSTIRNINKPGTIQNKSKSFKAQIENSIANIKNPRSGRGEYFIPSTKEINIYKEWFSDRNIGGVLNHQTRSHIEEDIRRYFFCACFANEFNRSPKLSDFPKMLLPDHVNIGIGVSDNHFGDRFRVQLPNEPSKTITSHISKDGHYYIHYDATQCRSLTVREAARIQTFPDNYFFCGPRTQQFHQVGNAVPPLLAKQIAIIVYDIIFKI